MARVRLRRQFLVSPIRSIGLVRGQSADAGMGPVSVVVADPVADAAPGFGAGLERVQVGYRNRYLLMPPSVESGISLIPAPNARDIAGLN